MFRLRLLLAFAVVALLPLALFAFGVRREMEQRLTAQYQRRVEQLRHVIVEDLEEEGRAIADRLASLEGAIRDDNRLRLAVAGSLPEERRRLIDFAARAMRLTGLSMLQIQDSAGRILSSGHFRNEYDRLEPELPRLLEAAGGTLALVVARTPEEPFLALARSDTFRVAGSRFSIAGGRRVDSHFLRELARDTSFVIRIEYPGGSLSSRGGEALPAGSPEPRADVALGELALPYADAEAGRLREARLVIAHPLGELLALQRRVDVWFLMALAAIAALCLLLATWFSRRFSRPIAELARKTSRVDLDRLDVDFHSHRRDEIGALSRLLGAMTDRLRTGASRLREAERRATLGELARQVNHDIKNGLVPIRNVVRHLAEVARDDPPGLPAIFEERRRTLDSSIAYLENLASNYARLYPRLESRACAVNPVVRRIVSGSRSGENVTVEARLSGDEPFVVADPVALRRIIENLVENAVDALEGREGRVVVATAVEADGSEGEAVSISVEDTGRGMSEDEIAQAFDDFYTTKPDGTGLGLSIVRRLVMDLQGTVRVESEPGAGTRFVVRLPRAGEAGATELAGGAIADGSDGGPR